jgi:hypothetical protein
MNYLFKGNLCGYLCTDCTETLSGVEVLLYLPWKKETVIENSVSNAKDTFRLVSEDEKASRKDLLIATTKTDDKGNFEFKLEEQYSRIAFDLDFICSSVSGATAKSSRKEPLQFHVTTIYPEWRMVQEKAYSFYKWQYCISSKWWCHVRGYYFDAWVICGHLVNCETKKPIANAIVTAWDADFLTDDNLGSAITDAAGHFRIDYTSLTFKKTFLSPWLNIETDPGLPLHFQSGPDVYFKAAIGGVNLINETSADRRNNVDYCLCVNLCSTVNVGNPDDSFPSAWTGIGDSFDVDFGAGPRQFDVDGYAGTAKYALASTIKLTGQAPAKTTSGNSIEYRFLISDVTTPNGGAAPAIGNFTKIIGVTPNLFAASMVAKLMEKVSPFTSYPVVSDQADFDTDGWFDINNAIARTQTIYGLGTLGNYFFIEEDTLMSLNTAALTTAPNVAANAANVGDVFPNASKIPIEKFSIRFEIREVVNKPSNIFNAIIGSGKTLNSAIMNNNAAFLKLSVKQLEELGDCSPISGTLQAKYTVHHPHLKDVSIHVRNNSNSINKNLLDSFITLSGNTNAAVNAGNNNFLQINANPNDLVRCTYSITLYVTRRLHNGDSPLSHGEQQILFFYNI